MESRNFKVNILAKITTIPFLLAFNLKICQLYVNIHEILLFPEFVSLLHEITRPVGIISGFDPFHRFHPGCMFCQYLSSTTSKTK
jgi:hypothetical protein